MTAPTTQSPAAPVFPDFAPVPAASIGPAVNEQGCCIGRVERNLCWVTDGTYQALPPRLITSRESGSCPVKWWTLITARSQKG
jgi:hypothetical protein